MGSLYLASTPISVIAPGVAAGSATDQPATFSSTPQGALTPAQIVPAGGNAATVLTSEQVAAVSAASSAVLNQVQIGIFNPVELAGLTEAQLAILFD